MKIASLVCFFVFLYFSPLTLHAVGNVSSEKIGEEFQEPEGDVPANELQKELSQAEEDFQKAKKMFNPWYAGPLLTGSAHVLPVGMFNVQPYIFVTDNYARFNAKRKSSSIPDLLQINTPFILQTGLFPKVDVTVTPQYIHNEQNSISYGGLGDTSLSFGIALMQETPYLPALKLAVSESFPTGKYKNLSPLKNGLDALGSGAYQTTLSLNASKIIWWWLLHPVSLRFSANYKIPTSVKVKEFNAYGGGFGTDGKVKLGHSFTVNFAFEYSITQNWVFASDFSFVSSLKSTFKGIPGITSTLETATVGSSYSDQLSIAPAIEYLFNSNIGILGGAWFSVYGKNSSHFISGVISATAAF